MIDTPWRVHERPHQRQDLAPDRGVEAGDRLVGQQQRRLQRHGRGDQHALALPTGQLVREAAAGTARRDAGRRR
jgi:hypothetical protein